MAVVQKIFRILKLAQVTWSFIGHVGQLALSKNSVGSNFPKMLQDSHLIQKIPKDTQTKLSERKKGMW